MLSQMLLIILLVVLFGSAWLARSLKNAKAQLAMHAKREADQLAELLARLQDPMVQHSLKTRVQRHEEIQERAKTFQPALHPGMAAGLKTGLIAPPKLARK